MSDALEALDAQVSEPGVDATSNELRVPLLLSTVLRREQMEVQLRRDAVSKGMLLERPDLQAIMGSKAGSFDHYINTHHTQLAAAAPNTWEDHVFGLKRDFTETFRYATSPDNVGFFFQRPKEADILGWKMFDHYRSETILLSTFPTFQMRFTAITGGIFNGLRYSNAVVSGGIVLACMIGNEADSKSFQGSDVDFFLYDTTPFEAEQFLQHLEQTLRQNIPNYTQYYHFTRTVNTFTFTPTMPAVTAGLRKVQIVTTIYSTIPNIISHFDLAPCALAYDGEEVWMTAHALRSLWTGYTYVTDAIRGSSASRIMKYAQRGYALRLNDLHHPEDIRLRDVLSDKSILPRKMVRRWEGKLTANRISILVTRTGLGRKGQWTHSLSGLVSLSVLWELVQGHVHLENALIASSNGGGMLYGLYSEPTEQPSQGVIAETYAEAFVRMNFVSAQASNSGTFEIYGRTECLLHVDTSLSMAYKTTMTMSVILPVGLRIPLSRLSRMRLSPARGSRIVQDAANHEFELCIWELPPWKLWGPAPQKRTAAAIRILKSAVALTAWAIHKVEMGAPWHRFNYGNTFARILENDVDAALVREAHFQEWFQH
ncbi:hypothetical protein CF319_g7957 [Tilletia indica]|nr:hypothetical protein CF319_g7957 [Tilletia indica]